MHDDTTVPICATVRTDIENLQDYDVVKIYPRIDNPLHAGCVLADYMNGYFYCHTSKQEEWPDYYLGDFLKFNRGFELVERNA